MRCSLLGQIGTKADNQRLKWSESESCILIFFLPVILGHMALTSQTSISTLSRYMGKKAWKRPRRGLGPYMKFGIVKEEANCQPGRFETLNACKLQPILPCIWICFDSLVLFYHVSSKAGLGLQGIRP